MQPFYFATQLEERSVKLSRMFSKIETFTTIKTNSDSFGLKWRCE